MDTERLDAIVEKYLADESFFIPNIRQIVGEEYYDFAMEKLRLLITDFGKRLTPEILESPELFSQCLEKYFMSNDIFEFFYNTNVQKAFKPNEQLSLLRMFCDKVKEGHNSLDWDNITLTRKEEGLLNKLLAHTFFPLTNGITEKGEYGREKPHRAICSGFAQLGCIIAEYFGFEVTPLAAHVLKIDPETGEKKEAYPYAHYLLAVKKGDNMALLDPQSANTQYHIIMSNVEREPNMDTTKYQNEALHRVDDMHQNMIFIATSEKKQEPFERFNASRFICGGLGANIKDLVEYVRQNPSIAGTTFVLNKNGMGHISQSPIPTTSTSK